MSATTLVQRDVYDDEFDAPLSVRVLPECTSFVELYTRDDAAIDVWGDIRLTMDAEVAAELGRALIAAAAEAKQD